MSKGSNSSATLPDVPTELIHEAAKTFPQCSLRVTRRNAKGRIATIISNVPTETLDLIDLPNMLRGYAGGGEYTVYPHNPAGDFPPYVVPKFFITLEGPSKIPANATTTGGVLPPQASMGMAPPQGVPNGWPAAPTPTYGNGGMMPPMAGNPFGRPNAPIAAYASDQMAMQNVSMLRQELGQLRSDAKAERDRREREQRLHEEKLVQMQQDCERQLAGERRRAEDDRRRQEDQRRADERLAQQQQLQQMQ